MSRQAADDEIQELIMKTIYETFRKTNFVTHLFDFDKRECKNQKNNMRLIELCYHFVLKRLFLQE